LASAHAKAAPAAAAASVDSGPTTTVGSPMTGRVVSLDEVNDKVFASRILGQGVGIVPTNGHVVAPVSGVLLTVPKSGHAFGIKTDDGVEVLVHVGIDTVKLKGEHFTVAVEKGQHVVAGDLLAKVDLDGVRASGFDTTTVVVITNTKTMGSVTPRTGIDAQPGDTIIDVAR
ncbi:MAG TPA: PTS glucose transporter subunit IIA, partial [Propionibacteriaceae bacterium]|nr:PTS glucose transporter subunit IIA [Propionibacteriaceae bacterium]